MPVVNAMKGKEKLLFYLASKRVLQNHLLIVGPDLDKVASPVMIEVSFVRYCMLFYLVDDKQQVLDYDQREL